MQHNGSPEHTTVNQFVDSQLNKFVGKESRFFK